MSRARPFARRAAPARGSRAERPVRLAPRPWTWPGSQRRVKKYDTHTHTHTPTPTPTHTQSRNITMATGLPKAGMVGEVGAGAR